MLCPKILLLMFPIHKAKGTSSSLGAGEHEAHLHPQVNCSHACVPRPNALSIQPWGVSEEKASNAAPQHIRRHFSNIVFKAIGLWFGFFVVCVWGLFVCFLKCFEAKSSGTHSSSNSAVPEENKAADNQLCTTRLPHCIGSIFQKDYQIEWKDRNHRGLWDRSDTVHFLAQLKGWAPVLTEGQGQSTGKETEVAISTTSQFLIPEGMRWLLCSSSAWQEGEKSLMALLLPHQHRNSTAPGKKLQPLPTVCNTESTAPEKGELRRPPSRLQTMQPGKAEQSASQRSWSPHESPRSCIWAKPCTILAGVVATMEEVRKLSQLSLWSLKSHIHGLPLTFSTVKTYIYFM